MSAVFEAALASFRYGESAPLAVDEASLRVEPADFCALIGPNGSGKSTLLKLLLGVLRPTSGTVNYLDRPAAECDRRIMAQQIGVVPQLEEMLFPFTVRELVAMGRYPHLGAWQRERDQDRAAIERAMQRCDVAALADRSVLNLSGGERQRVRVARALAQEPRSLVLDEPTAALDIGHEMALFELLAELRAVDDVTVVAATHNVNLAGRFASQVALFDRGRTVAFGASADVLTSERISAVYHWPVSIQPHPGPGADTGAPQVVVISRRS
jgi:iron complex transport system ATP-binding protein